MGNYCFRRTREIIYDKYEKEFLKYRVPIINGKKNGTQTNFAESGDILCTMEYLNGKYHGLFQLFSEDGNLKQEIHFQSGKKHGPEYHFIKNNTEGPIIVSFHALYQKGRLLYNRTYNNMEMNQIEECCICFQETNFKLFCSHTVCPSCTKKIKKCPVCRKFRQEYLHLID